MHGAARRRAQRGITLLVVEHDMHFVGGLCERVVVLNFGVQDRRLRGARDPCAIRQVREAYLGTG